MADKTLKEELSEAESWTGDAVLDLIHNVADGHIPNREELCVLILNSHSGISCEFSLEYTKKKIKLIDWSPYSFILSFVISLGVVYISALFHAIFWVAMTLFFVCFILYMAVSLYFLNKYTDNKLEKLKDEMRKEGWSKFI